MLKRSVTDQILMKHHRLTVDKPWLIATFIIAVVIAVVVLVGNLSATMKVPFFCSSSAAFATAVMPIQIHAILHYATSRETPQLTRAEIQVGLHALHAHSPCNFLVFGLGHDSLMWSSFNPNGLTLFLEEDPVWVRTMLTKAPNLRVHTVNYHTHLYDAMNLMGHYKLEPYCYPPKLCLRGNAKCRLALSDLADEVYNKEWDVILIDGPTGYFPEAPGRMAAVFTAAVMARLRNRPGITHVMLHDVNRRVERAYAERFLCKRFLVDAVDRLWHFVIPPASKEDFRSPNTFFCPS